MQAYLKTASRIIQISNEDATTKPKSNHNPVKITTVIRKVMVVLLFFTLCILLIRTYLSGSPHFWSLLKVTGILTMVASISFLSNNTGKNQR